MNFTYLGMELKRAVRDVQNLFFITILPLFLFLVFININPGIEEILPSGRGNLAMYLMISMAVYGAATATTTIGGLAGVERMQGWGRQLGLTPMSDAGFVAIKSVLGVIIASMPILLIFLVGAFTKSEADPEAWLISAAITLAGSILFALYGLATGLLFRSEAAVGAAAGGLALLGFLGNAFMPLSGVMLTIARFTPMYGYAQLARYHLMAGEFPDGYSAGVFQEPLWIPIVNYIVWTLIFAVLAVSIVRRGRARQ